MILGPLFVIALGVWILWGAVSKSSRAEVNLNLPIEDATSARIKISHAAGKLKLKAGTDADTFMQGLFRGGVDKKIQRNGDVIDLSLKMPASDFNLNWAPGDFFDWSINMTKDIPLSFDVETGAAEVSFDLTELQVNNLQYKSGASSSEIYFPAHAKMTTSRIEADCSGKNIHPTRCFCPNPCSGRVIGDRRRYQPVHPVRKRFYFRRLGDRKR